MIVHTSRAMPCSGALTKRKTLRIVVQRRLTKLVKALDFHEKQLRELWLYSLEKSRVKVDLITLNNYLRSWQGEDQSLSPK